MSGLIRELPPHDRPRERLERLGAGSLTDSELLAVLLRTGCKGVSAVELGRRILVKFGTLEQLGKATVSEIATIPGVGKSKAVLLKAAFEITDRVSKTKLDQEPMDTPDRIYAYMSEKVRFSSVEVLYGLALDSKLRLIRAYEISSGLLNQTLVHAREAYREAIAASAAHLVIVHNHPSGDPKPSPDDIRATKELQQAGRIIGIPLLDHVILGKVSNSNPRGFISLKESGFLS